MTTANNYNYNDPNAGDSGFYVVHPLDDAPEQKKSIEGLGQIHMSPSVKLSLLALRGYLVLVTLLALYRLYTVVVHAGVFGGHHLPH